MCAPPLRSVSAEKYENLGKTELSFHCHNFSASKLEENLGPAGHLMCPTSFPMAASLGSTLGRPLWPLTVLAGCPTFPKSLLHLELAGLLLTIPSHIPAQHLLEAQLRLPIFRVIIGHWPSVALMGAQHLESGS